MENDFMKIPTASEQLVHTLARRIDHLRRETEADSREWGEGLTGAIESAFQYLTSRLDEYDRLAMEKVLLQMPTPVEGKNGQTEA